MIILLLLIPPRSLKDRGVFYFALFEPARFAGDRNRS